MPGNRVIPCSHVGCTKLFRRHADATRHFKRQHHGFGQKSPQIDTKYRRSRQGIMPFSKIFTPCDSQSGHEDRSQGQFRYDEELERMDHDQLEGSDNNFRNGLYCTSDDSEMRTPQEEGVFEFSRPTHGQPIPLGEYQPDVLLNASTDVEDYAPFNSSIDLRLAVFYNQHPRISESRMNALLSIITDPLFKPESVSYKNVYQLKKQLAKVRTADSSGWRTETVTVPNHSAKEKTSWSGSYTFLARDSLSVVKRMLRQDHLQIQTRGVYKRLDGERLVDEIWTSDEYLSQEDALPENACVLSVLLSSDATQLSMFTGDLVAWPLYISLGNISRSNRGKPKNEAWQLVALLPKLRGTAVERKHPSWTLASKELYHACMRVALNSLWKKEESGFESIGPNALVFKWYPRISGLIMDYQEICTALGIRSGRCPSCLVKKCHLHYISDEWVDAEPRVKEDMMQLREAAIASQSNDQNHLMNGRLKDAGIQITNIFGFDWTTFEPYQSARPDILHQLLKGVFGQHALKKFLYGAMDSTRKRPDKNNIKPPTLTSVSSKETRREFDRRFATMPRWNSTVKQFKKGILSISQTNGKDNKAILKVIVGVVFELLPKFPAVEKGPSSAHIQDQFIRLFAALSSFYYVATSKHYTRSDDEIFDRCILDMERAFTYLAFVFKLNIDFPKLHSLKKYKESALKSAPAANYTTEPTEHQHIDLKNAYRTSNKQNAWKQMTSHIETRLALKSMMLKYMPETADTGPKAMPEETFLLPKQSKVVKWATLSVDVQAAIRQRIWEEQMYLKYGLMTREQLEEHPSLPNETHEPTRKDQIRIFSGLKVFYEAVRHSGTSLVSVDNIKVSAQKDFVVVASDEVRELTIQTVTGWYFVYELHMILEVEYNESKYRFALGQLLHADECLRYFNALRRTRPIVPISLSDIIRRVHMIPRFNHQNQDGSCAYWILNHWIDEDCFWRLRVPLFIDGVDDVDDEEVNATIQRHRCSAGSESIDGYESNNSHEEEDARDGDYDGDDDGEDDNVVESEED